MAKLSGNRSGANRGAKSGNRRAVKTKDLAAYQAKPETVLARDETMPRPKKANND